MAENAGQILSYATSAARPARFRNANAVLPYSGGLIVGVVLVFLIRAIGPVFAAPIGVEVLAIFILVVLATVYASVVLFLLGLLFSTGLSQGPPSINGIVGLGILVLGAVIFEIGNAICVVLSPPYLSEESVGWTALVITTLATLVAPFFLVRWRDHWRLHEPNRKRVQLLLKRIVPAFSVLIILLGLGRLLAEKRYDRDCAEVASWIKTNHPSPGTYEEHLPPSQYSLTPDHIVDAAVLPDGRIVLMLQTSMTSMPNWSAIIYATGPITPGEIGKDIFGRPRIRIDGFGPHFVKKRIDSRHFIVGSDGNWSSS